MVYDGKDRVRVETPYMYVDYQGRQTTVFEEITLWVTTQAMGEEHKQQLSRIKFAIINGEGPNCILLNEDYFKHFGVQSPEVLVWKALGGDLDKLFPQYDGTTSGGEEEEVVEDGPTGLTSNIQAATDRAEESLGVSSANIPHRIPAQSEEKSEGNPNTSPSSMVEGRLNSIAYALVQLRVTQLGLIRLGAELNEIEGNEETVTKIWNATSEMSSAMSIIREETEELQLHDRKQLISRYNRKANEEMERLTPRIRKAPEPNQSVRDVVIELNNDPSFELATMYQPAQQERTVRIVTQVPAVSRGSLEGGSASQE